MATNKTTKASTTTKAAEKKAAPKKATETKAVETKATETKATETKATATKAAASKKTTETKAAAKKSELYVQFAGLEFSYDELLEKVKADYIAQSGKKTISSTKLYLKPEDMTVYYVINEKFMGHVYLG